MLKAIIENKSSTTLHGLKPGAKTTIKVDAHGVPKDQHWRRRLKDSVIDGCIEIKTQSTNIKKEIPTKSEKG